MKFTKMHGCGNDYVYVNCCDQYISDRAAIAKRISDRHFGVGSDGLICIDSSEVADFKMDMYNADGSQGKMCGNGIRCVGKYVFDYGLTQKTDITVETLSGVKRLHLNIVDGLVESVRVCMGHPEFKSDKIPVLTAEDCFIGKTLTIKEKQWEMTCVSMGNPHCVIFVDDVDALDLEEIGPCFENHELFPERINTEFVEVLDETHLKMRVWERGSGETLACGTGTCAAHVAAVIHGYVKERSFVIVRGGTLEIEWDRSDNLVYMTGPAVVVFDGEIMDI